MVPGSACQSMQGTVPRRPDAARTFPRPHSCPAVAMPRPGGPFARTELEQFRPRRRGTVWDGQNAAQQIERPALIGLSGFDVELLDVGQGEYVAQFLDRRRPAVGRIPAPLKTRFAGGREPGFGRRPCRRLGCRHPAMAARALCGGAVPYPPAVMLRALAGGRFMTTNPACARYRASVLAAIRAVSSAACRCALPRSSKRSP